MPLHQTSRHPFAIWPHFLNSNKTERNIISVEISEKHSSGCWVGGWVRKEDSWVRFWKKILLFSCIPLWVPASQTLIFKAVAVWAEGFGYDSKCIKTALQTRSVQGLKFSVIFKNWNSNLWSLFKFSLPDNSCTWVSQYLLQSSCELLKQLLSLFLQDTSGWDQEERVPFQEEAGISSLSSWLQVSLMRSYYPDKTCLNDWEYPLQYLIVSQLPPCVKQIKI